MSPEPAVMPEPAWVRHAVLWQVYPLGFLGADVSGADRASRRTLADLIPWLGYAAELGCSAVALGPVFESETHGYDTIDHFAIDSRLGGLSDFDALVAAARDRGLRIVLDGVFNHVGRRFARFLDAQRGDEEAQAWFRPAPDLPGGYATFEGHEALVALDHANPQVVDYIARVMTHWLDAGASGWRLDAAYAVSPAVWARVVERVRARHPQAYLFAEVLHGDYARFVAESGVDSVTQYELWKAIWSSISDANFHELAWALRRHQGMLERFAPQTFIGNHDVTRIAAQIGDARHRAHALVLLMTLGGTPSIYAGDERGMQAVKENRAGGDDAIRPAFPAAPSGLSGGEDVLRLHQRLIGLRRRHPWLHRASADIESLANDQLMYRLGSDGRALRVALNLGDRPMTARIAAPDVSAWSLRAGEAQPAGPLEWRIAPHGWAVLGCG
ncbi:MAG: DUF3459 domain-containing protein [Frankiaceae bacterium]|jgi:cyclomaltodextrinase|nr:DUF3459 domain-containing protein [Frankiaceae bacterium]